VKGVTVKKLITISLSIVVGFVLAIALIGLPLTVRAGGDGAEKCAAQNGDVNADGKVDLTDAVTILGNLFLGNPTELVTLCAPPSAPSGLPATGQSKCYDDVGRVIPCDSATCRGQDGFYRAGCPSEGRFADNGNGTVTDTCTGLMWQKETADTNEDGKIDDSDRRTWCEALAYCEKLSFAGHNDWRLPNVREIQSIVDYGRSDPSIDPVFGALPFLYWSSTSGVPNADAWNVTFSSGYVNVWDKNSNEIYVRAVRNAP